MSGASGPSQEPYRQVELSIDGIATGGDGVGRDEDGRVVFVPRSAPGDRVRVRVVEARRRWARGELVDLLAAGPGRRAAPCPVYEQCGGCSLQHLEIETQRDAKRDIVQETLRRIGGLTLDVPRIVASGPEFGYRNRISLTLRRDGDRISAGFRSRTDAAHVIDTPDCLLAEPSVRRAFGALRAGWGDGARRLPPGEELRITVRAGVEGDVALYIEAEGPNAAGDPVELLGSIPRLVTVTRSDRTGADVCLAGASRFRDRWQGSTFELPGRVFLQVNREESAALDRALDALVGPRDGSRIADLYAGVGARALRWAREGAILTAVESDSAACASGRRAAEDQGLDIRFVAARVEDSFDFYRSADVVIVNPPRAGLSPAVCARLCKASVSRGLAYVSCDPATLARDLRLLASAWTPKVASAFDAFPQTHHVETLVWLEPGAAGPGGRAEAA